MKKVTILIVFTLCFTVSMDAQFLKNLGNKIERAAERTIERKAEEKTTEATEQALDSVFTNNSENEKKRNSNILGISKADPAANYAFNHQITMQITTEKEETELDYLIPNTGNFLGIAIKDEKRKEDFFTILDIDKEAMFTFMNNNGEKMIMGIGFDYHEAVEENNYTISKTGKTKTVMGYNCEEYYMTGEDMTANVWVTNEVDFRFPADFYKVKQKKGHNQVWMEALDGWMMEMEMTDTSKRKPQTTTMKCLSIGDSDLKINSSEYKSLGF